ncbi:MAG: DMT family transporter, partial [Pseudomonadota bacterium]
VVMVPFLSIIVLRQVPHAIIWPAALATLFGIYLLSGGDIQTLKRGDYWTILCAFLWAWHVILLSRILRNDSVSNRPITLACTQFFVCAALGISIGMAIETVSWTAIVNTLPEILFAGVISGGVAFTLQAFAQRFTTAPQAAIFMSSESLFAALFGAIFLSERIGFVGLIGCMLIFTAMLMVELVPMLSKNRTSAT